MEDIKDLRIILDDFYFRSFSKEPIWIMNGLVGELGEVANILKKRSFDKQWSNKVSKLSDKNILDELGDSFYYFNNLVNSLGFTIEDVIDCQAKKLIRDDKAKGRKFRK